MPQASDGEFLRQYLAGRDVPCPSCGYNLRALATDRCPECGDAIILRVGLVHPRQAAFITGLVGLAMGAGFSGLLIVYVILHIIFGLRPIPEGFVFFVAVPALIEGAVLLLWVAQARRIRLWRGSVRWSAAILAWVMTLTNVVVFSYYIG